MELDGAALVKLLAVTVILLVVLYALLAFFLPLVSVVKEKAGDTGTRVGGAVRDIQEVGRMVSNTSSHDYWRQGGLLLPQASPTSSVSCSLTWFEKKKA